MIRSTGQGPKPCQRCRPLSGNDLRDAVCWQVKRAGKFCGGLKLVARISPGGTGLRVMGSFLSMVGDYFHILRAAALSDLSKQMRHGLKLAFISIFSQEGLSANKWGKTPYPAQPRAGGACRKALYVEAARERGILSLHRWQGEIARVSTLSFGA